jgi:hypothetical protein
VVVAEQVQQPWTSGQRHSSPTTCGQRTTSPSARGTPSGSASRPSIGNESTSVGSSIPRCSRFNALHLRRRDEGSPSSPSATPSVREAPCRASAAAAASSTREAAAVRDLDLDPSMPARGASLLGVQLLYASTIR